jgi:hypothetical protein
MAPGLKAETSLTENISYYFTKEFTVFAKYENVACQVGTLLSDLL